MVAWAMRTSSAYMVGSTTVRRGGVGCRLLVHGADGKGWHVAHLQQSWQQQRLTARAAAIVVSRLALLAVGGCRGQQVKAGAAALL